MYYIMGRTTWFYRIYLSKHSLLVFQGNGFVTVSHLKNDLKWEEERAHRALVCEISLSLLLAITLMY